MLSFKARFVHPSSLTQQLLSSAQNQRRERNKKSRERKHRNMLKSTNLLVICAVILVTHMITLSFLAVEASPTGSDQSFGWIPTTTVAGGGGCRGSMAECLAEGGDLDIDDMELSMDSETNRRILATSRRYISYGALSRNNVPCSRRGASYYNCRSGGQANPYSRGCSTITRCRR